MENNNETAQGLKSPSVRKLSINLPQKSLDHMAAIGAYLGEKSQTQIIKRSLSLAAAFAQELQAGRTLELIDPDSGSSSSIHIVF